MGLSMVFIAKICPPRDKVLFGSSFAQQDAGIPGSAGTGALGILSQPGAPCRAVWAGWDPKMVLELHPHSESELGNLSKQF